MLKPWWIALVFCWIASSAGAVTITFQLRAEPGKKYALRGGSLPLRWEQDVAMVEAVGNPGLFTTSVTFGDTNLRLVEYKFVQLGKTVRFELEGWGNRLLLLQGDSVLPETRFDAAPHYEMFEFPLLAPAEMRADLAFLKEVILTLHPGWDRYLTRQQLDSLFEGAQQRGEKPLRRADFFIELSSLTAALQCGHTFPSFFNQNGLNELALFEGKRYLPMQTKVIGHRMFVNAYAGTDGALLPGDEVLSLQGVPVGEVLQRVRTLIKADAGNVYKRQAELNVFGVPIPESFDVYQALLYPPQDGQYNLVVKRANGQTSAASVAAMDRQSRSSRLLPADFGWWEKRMLNDSTVYLRLSTFDGFALPFDGAKWLQQAFADIKKSGATVLLLDVRWNEGGQDDLLLALGQHLIQQPLQLIERESRVRYQQLPAAWLPQVRTWDAAYYDLRARTQPVPGEAYFLLDADKPSSAMRIKPAKNAFKGKIILLLNGANSSAGFYLAELARTNHLAILAGEPTGGSQQGLNAGVIFFVTLPHSQMEVDVPAIGSFSPQKPMGGIAPDWYFPENADTWQPNKDAVLEGVLQRLAGKAE